MFLSAVIPLRALNTPAEQPYLGRACHAFFLREVARADASLAESLHRSQRDKGFTVSPVMNGSGSGGQPAIQAGHDYWLRVTSLEAGLSGRLLDSVLPHLPRQVQLGPAEFSLGEALAQAGDHPWAGQASAETLLERWLGRSSLPGWLTLEFATPTCSRRIEREWVLPTPAVVFGSYLRAWNAFGRPAFDGDLTRLIEADVLVSDYRLRTLRLQIGEAEFRGWTGQVTYRIFARERGLRAMLHLLADFAPFCGTGYKTTQGMGQTRPLRGAARER